MAKGKPPVKDISTATIGFEAAKESSPEFQLAGATRDGLPPHPGFRRPHKSRIYDAACGSGGRLPTFQAPQSPLSAFRTRYRATRRAGGKTSSNPTAAWESQKSEVRVSK